jgi:methylmalonyl-CoA mutase
VRALRKLWAKMLEVCSIPPGTAAIHAETSYRMMTIADPETNILRATIAGFAAAAGGADSISILPHTIAHGLPDGFARRIARNVQLVMAEESHIGFVADPASGSGGIEALTDALCEKAWEEFRAIEKEGGILRSLAEGHLQRRIAAARDDRASQYREGKLAIVGTTLYRLDKNKPVDRLGAEKRPMPTDGAVFCERLDVLRTDELIGEQP